MANTGGVYTWSKTATANATADNTVNYAEGQAPSTLNDAGRAAMTSIAKWRDDISGAIVTTGSATAYAVSSNQNFDTLADMNGMLVAFTPNVTNAAGPVTLNVDGLGAKFLRTAPNVDLLTGTVVQGTPYVAIYNNADGAFYLQGFFGANPYNIPLGGMLPFAGVSGAPNSSFAFPYGQAISRTTYASLFALCSTFYGTGDGSTTFNLPDLRGRVPFGLDTMGGVASGRVTSAGGGIDGTTIGATGGSQAPTMQRSDLPNVAPSWTSTTPGFNYIASLNTSSYLNGNNSAGTLVTGGNFAGSPTVSGVVGSINGGVAQTGFKAMPPAIIVPYLIRII